MPTFTRRTLVPVPVETLFTFHARQGAFERLMPPWQAIRVVERKGTVGAGDYVRMKIGRFIQWSARNETCVPPHSFTDVQTSGPFKSWKHTHLFSSAGTGQSILEDTIEYALPFGLAGKLLGSRVIDGTLEHTFLFRQRQTVNDLVRHARYSSKPLRIAIAGAGGFIASHLIPYLTTAGHTVIPIVRRPSPALGLLNDEAPILWDPAKKELDAARLESLDAVINLAGQNIVRRWNARAKREIEDSRTESTFLLARALDRVRKKPRVFISASGIGYYGDRGDEPLTESAPPGQNFLADLCQHWEQATHPAADSGIRTVILRIGVVLHPQGGALKKMLPAAKLGLSGPIGTGDQWVSWIALDDLLGLIEHAIHCESLSGPVNAVAPNPVTNRGFVKTLAPVVGRPAWLPFPTGAVKLLFGEMGLNTLLASQRVVPAAAERADFMFLHPSLEPALRLQLGRMPRELNEGPGGQELL